MFTGHLSDAFSSQVPPQLIFIIIGAVRIETTDAHPSSGMDKRIISYPHANMNNPLWPISSGFSSEKEQITHFQFIPVFLRIHQLTFMNLLRSISWDHLAIKKINGLGKSATIHPFDGCSSLEVRDSHHILGSTDQVLVTKGTAGDPFVKRHGQILIQKTLSTIRQSHLIMVLIFCHLS